MIRARSIRLRAALALAVPVTLLWLGAATVTARLLTGEMEEVFDSALQETGQRLLQLAVIEVLNREDEGVTRHVAALDAHEEYFTYLVRDDRGRVLLASHAAEAAQVPVFAAPGFHQTADFRFYQESAVRGTVTLTIAEPLAHRRDVAGELTLALALPVLLVLPLGVLAILYGLGFGLRPLGLLRDQVARRNAHDLAPLAAEGLPAELRPIADSMNQLFARLDAAFDAERSFAATAAHELRTPLAGAVLQLQRLQRRTAEPETARAAAEIEASLKRLTHLSARLMQLARAEGARLVGPPQDLRPVLDLVAQDFDRGADAGRLHLALPDAPVISTLDPDAVAIIARNLIENALRHGSGDAVQASLAADGAFCVRNHGPAIPPDRMHRLLRRFEQGQTAAGSIGSGLGLTIVQTIANRCGTTLHLASPAPGQDDGFAATIRLLPQPAPAGPPQLAPPAR